MRIHEPEHKTRKKNYSEEWKLREKTNLGIETKRSRQRDLNKIGYGNQEYSVSTK